MNTYLTERYATRDPDRILAFVAEFPFATLIPQGEVRGALPSLPVLLDVRAGSRIVFYGHLDRENPFAVRLDRSRVTALFQGPNGYISPRDYVSRQFPTWNYAVAQVTGVCRLVDEPDRKLAYMIRMVEDLERHNGSDYRLDGSDNRVRRQIDLVTFFQLEVDSVHGTFKFAQEKTVEDRVRARDRLIDKLHSGQSRAIPVLADLDPGERP
ncbi:FMN-binding negative transcriptional regulator [Actinocrispum wychmicini]|uniref:PaiB family negative transcriptional regulator n=1 Tax=Actinocrispum wychmicini TaxID=1213861 RepID=A0A4R2JQS9_9PSEU|nr:FMN-binding negative transcriptional regulator [Actinocrispum wychmicini]TCO59556.1 PaiB family negative transcriptional regulator [Actinocrispum wychmicini]